MVANTRIDLIVDRTDNEVVGALGAFWDPNHGTWFVDAGADLEPFASWLPAKPKGVSLSEFLGRVKSVVSQGLPDAEWVRTEINELREARSGHTYLKLVERNELGDVLAETDARIWKVQAQAVKGKFSEETGDELKDDIKVLVRVRAGFHVQYGFALSIEDIDPSYTLGDLLAKLQRIRETLQRAGVFAKNKGRPTPSEFVRVAVISPETSAGLGDFRREADLLHQAGLCRFDYFPATFQGVEAPPSIREAIREVYESHNVRPYDALAIIRGGGSVTDLAWLNDLELARWVCRVPIPVFTGIGHERDSTILDEVAHRRFDTPSKVATHIAHTIRDNARDAIADLDRIETQVGRILVHQETKLTLQRQRLVEQMGRSLKKAEEAMVHRDREIRTSAEHHVREAELALSYTLDRMADRAKTAICDADLALQRSSEAVALRSQKTLETASRDLDHLRTAIRTNTIAIQKNARIQVESYTRTIIGMGPQSTLQRGYAIARDPEGQPVSSRENALNHQELKIQFRDGELAVSNREYWGYE